MERAAREADYLRHASDELKKLAPKDGEESALAERRATMMQGEKIAADLREAQEAVSGNAFAGRRACRRRCAGWSAAPANSPALVEPAVKAIDAAINALEEADQHLERRADRGRFRSRRARTHRGAAVRAARRVAQIFNAGRWAGGAGGEICRRRGADRCRRRAVEEARGGGGRSRPALQRGRDKTLRRAHKSRAESSTRRSTPNWRR